MAIQSAVACSEAKDGDLLVSWQLMECVLVWVVSSSRTVEDGFLSIMDKSLTGISENWLTGWVIGKQVGWLVGRPVG